MLWKNDAVKYVKASDIYASEIRDEIQKIVLIHLKMSRILLWYKMSEAKTFVDGCVFCEIGQGKVPETELLYDDVDYAVFR